MLLTRSTVSTNPHQGRSLSVQYLLLALYFLYIQFGFFVHFKHRLKSFQLFLLHYKVQPFLNVFVLLKFTLINLT